MKVESAYTIAGEVVEKINSFNGMEIFYVTMSTW